MAADLIFVAGLNFNPILDPLGSSHIFMGQFQAKDSILSLHHVEVLHGLLYFHSCGNIHVCSYQQESAISCCPFDSLDLPSTLREADVLEVATS